jgi:macrolide glycosyltransferase
MDWDHEGLSASESGRQSRFFVSTPYVSTRPIMHVRRHAHISFIGFPLPPCVNPTVPVVSVLIRRGHRVSYVTAPRFSSRLSALGAEIVPCDDVRGRSIFASSMQASPDEDRSGVHPLCRFALETVKAVAPFYEAQRPDLIVYDIVSLAARMLAKRLGIPAIQTSPTFGYDEEHFAQQVPHRVFQANELDDCRRIDEFLAGVGLGGGRRYLFHREPLNIYFFPKALQPPGHVFGSECYYAGRCAAEQPYFGDWVRTSPEDRPIVLVSTSTTFQQGPDFFRLCLEALSDLSCHVILSVGDESVAAALRPLPAHFEIVQGVSHIRMLPHVSAFVCLGGVITTSEAAYHGVPLIITSQGVPELEWLGENATALGIGLHVRKTKLTAETLRAAVLRALRDESLLSRVRSLQRSVRNEPGSEDVANRIEDYLATVST